MTIWHSQFFNFYLYSNLLC